MFRILDDYPDAVLAVTGTGRISTEDYRDTLGPELRARRARHDSVRLLYHLDADFDRFATTALWDDSLLGMHNLAGFERVAVVTDLAWLRNLAVGAGVQSGGAVRAFPNSELAEARAWLLDGMQC